jgi:hypothetical protein
MDYYQTLDSGENKENIVPLFAGMNQGGHKKLKLNVPLQPVRKSANQKLDTKLVRYCQAAKESPSAGASGQH